MYQIGKMPGSIDIGFVGETKSTKIEIDMTEWMKKYPDGVPSIIHIRPGESKADAYVAVTEFDSETNVLTWEITAADIGTLEGDGDMQIWLEVAEDDEVVKRKKNKHVKTRVTDAVNDPDPTAPTSQAAFLEQVTEVKTATITAKDAAEDAQAAAETAQGKAEDAQEAAETAQGKAEDAQEAAETAQGKAEDAQEAAETAQTAAETAAATVVNKADKTMIAPDYSSLTFPVAKGTFCIHEGTIYEANQNISTSESWTAAHWDAVANLCGELASVKNAIAQETGDFTQVKLNGFSKYVPEWEAGDWGINGKTTADDKVRSKNLIYLPNGTYTVYSSAQLTVWGYPDSSASTLGVDFIWKQTGENTIKVKNNKNYIAFVCEGTSEPATMYAIVPTAVSNVIAQAEQNRVNIAADNSRITNNTEYSDGIFNAVTENVTTTLNKGIGSGVEVGSVVNLTDDNYSQVVALQIIPGKTYRIKAKVYNKYYLAHFVDDNNILIAKYTKNTTGSTYVFIDESVTAPEGSTKLMIAGMKNESILVDVFRPYTSKDLIDMLNTENRGAFCVMEFNVGDWYEGKYRDADNTSIIPADETIYTNYMSLFNSIFSRYKPDVSMLNEDAQNMCMIRKDDSRAFLGQYARYLNRAQMQSQQLTKVYDTIASKFQLFDVSTHYYVDTEQNMTRNYIKGYAYINGIKVCFICTHLSSDWETAKLNAAELLSDIQTENPEYMVLCGDFNLTPNVAQVQAFETAGYTVSYGSVTYDGHTYGPGDFIITTSNITVKNVFCDEQKIDASFVEYIDHLPTIAYLEIF